MLSYFKNSLQDLKEIIKTRAEQLFIQNGIKCITMDMLAKQLGISKKTIYTFYEDKTELVTAIFEQKMDECRVSTKFDKMRSENAIHEIYVSLESNFEILRNMNAAVMNDLHHHYPALYDKYFKFKNTFLLKTTSDNLERGIAEGLYKDDIPVDIMSRYRIGTMMISSNILIFPDKRYTLLDIEYILIKHFISGIATAKGMKLIEKYAQKYETSSNYERK